MKNLSSYLDRLTAVRMRPEVLQHAVDILKAVPQIQTELENPATTRMKREEYYSGNFPDRVQRIPPFPGRGWCSWFFTGYFKGIYGDVRGRENTSFLRPGICF